MLEPASESSVSTCVAVTVSTSLTARTASLNSRSVRPVSTRDGGASIPGANARTVTVPAGRSRRKRPSASVVVVTGAASGPDTVTVAPATGRPSGPSTRPDSGSAMAGAVQHRVAVRTAHT